jgi:hypothetical protein
MIDPTTERRYSDCRELMDLWSRYHDFFKVAVAQNEAVTPEKEHEFITVKSRIAMLHDSFMDCLEHDQNIGQNILSIVTRSITLKHVRRMSTAEIKKIELEWHESYLLLNETLGMLEDTRRKFASVTQSEFMRQAYTKKAMTAVKQFLSSWVFKSMVVFTVLLLAAWAFDRFGIREFAMQYKLTRNMTIKFEDVIRLAYKEYPFRELSSIQRMDSVPPASVKPDDMQVHLKPEFAPPVGIERVNRGMTGSEDNVAEDLKKKTACRAEIYRSLGAFGGDVVIWLYLMPTVQMAKDIEAKWDRWFDKNAAEGTDAMRWRIIRRSNVIGVVSFTTSSGGDPFTLAWVRDQYLRRRGK